jgi:GTP 3',8-cyclase
MMTVIMTNRIIPIQDTRADIRYHGGLPAIPAQPIVPNGLTTDRLGRRLHDLRISVTDRCNFRCTYCMPKSVFDKDYSFLPQSALLSFEEIQRIAKLFVSHGVEKIRLTGGEPLLRKHLETLIEKLATLVTPSGKPLDITLTTNGALLPKKAALLKAAGLTRLTVSLDAVDDSVFRKMNDVDFPVGQVLEGIDAAMHAGFDNIKINMVVKRGVNDDQILPMVQQFKGSGHTLRLIEFMDVGSSNGWDMKDVMPSAAVLAKINSVYPLKGLPANYQGEVAERWEFADGSGEIGVISSVTQTFCHDCTRLRLSTEGKLFTCLFATQGQDLRGLVRAGHSDEDIASAIGLIWQQRDDRYSELRSEQTQELKAARAKVEMSYIGG